MKVASAREIRGDFESQIARGELKTGDRLPSVRGLAEELGVSPATVSAAYRELRLRGMVSGRGRQGTRVAPARRPQATFQPQADSGLIDAANGSPDMQLLPDLGPALAFAASQLHPRYSTELVEPRLRKAAVALFDVDGIDATNLAITSGAMDAVERVMEAFDLRIGDRVGVEDPGHIPVHQLARSAGLELVPLAVDEHGVTPEALAAGLAGGLAAVVLTPRAHNPTGAALTEERAESLSALLKPHPSTALVLDDHAGLISGVDYFPVVAPGPRWATMRSLGKSLGPDLRVALVVGDDQTMRRVNTTLSNGPGWVSFLLQRTAAYLLSDKATAHQLDEAAKSYARRRDLLIGLLADKGINASGASGLNVWIPTTTDAAAIEACRRAGYAIRSSNAYQLTRSQAVRVTISDLNDTDISAIAVAISSVNQAGPIASPV